VFLNTENISAFVGFSWKIEIEMHGATMKKITTLVIIKFTSYYCQSIRQLLLLKRYVSVAVTCYIKNVIKQRSITIQIYSYVM
jgi:hypothetical protein